MRSFWNNHIDVIWNSNFFSHQIRGQVYWMFHLKTGNLEVIQATNTKTRPTVSIQSMHFVFPFCPMSTGINIIIPISKNTWKTEATLFSDFSSFLPLRVSSYEHEYSSNHPELIQWDFFSTKFTLRNLIPRPKSSLIDRGFAEFIFPNTTFIDSRDKTCLCSKLKFTTSHNSSIGSIEYFNTSDGSGGILHYTYEVPKLKTNQRYSSILLFSGKDVYSFLSCGDPCYDLPDFKAIFMPFSKTTWVLIFMTIVGWPLVLSLIENDFCFKKVLKDFDALFIGWAMILEQSHLRATNYKGRGPLYCYCGCVLLAIFILSNAYKGDNIRSLTKSFDLVPLTSIDHVMNAGYKKYTIRYCGVRDPLTKALNCHSTKFSLTSEFYAVARFSRNQFTDKQYQLWEPLDYLDISNGEDDELKQKFEWFGECREKKALLGWRSRGDLVYLEKKLRRKHKSAQISLGDDFIFIQHKGWRLDRYGNIKVLKRMWALFESGVYTELLNISYKRPIAQAPEPRKLTIYGNIFVQFAFLSCGLLLALLIFVAEFHKAVARSVDFVRNSVGFLIINFLQLSQKAFLIGLNNFLDNSCQLTKKAGGLMATQGFCTSKLKREL